VHSLRILEANATDYSKPPAKRLQSPEDEDSQDSNTEDDQDIGGGGGDEEDDNEGDAVQGANNHESGGGDSNVTPGQLHTGDGDDTADLRRDIQPEATGSKQIALEDDVAMLDGTTVTCK
jgi:hypothetical protein